MRDVRCAARTIHSQESDPTLPAAAASYSSCACAEHSRCCSRENLPAASATGNASILTIPQVCHGIPISFSFALYSSTAVYFFQRRPAKRCCPSTTTAVHCSSCGMGGGGGPLRIAARVLPFQRHKLTQAPQHAPPNDGMIVSSCC